jgi:oligopeptide/dipeptide ABC transporter ATP-binding protein
MKEGRIVESASVRELFRKPYHPYTRRLLAATPHARRDPQIRKLLAEQPVIQDVPRGWCIDEPLPSTSMEPMHHRFDMNREILLWPASAEATR